MHALSTTARRAVALVVAALSVLAVQTAAPSTAHAGTVGVTVEILGSGRVFAVEGVKFSCTTDEWDPDPDPDAVKVCDRFAHENVWGEAWVWLHAEVISEFAEVEWQGCNTTRTTSIGEVECGVHSDMFNSVEKRPRAIFRDTIAPEVRWGTVTQGTQHEREFVYSFTQGTGQAYCSFDDEPAERPCESPVTKAWATEGDHTVRVVARDRSGNQGAEISRTVRVVDTSIDSGPPPLTSSTSADLRVSSGAGTGLECSLDAGTWRWCPQGHEPGHLPFVGLTEGQHEVRVRATAAGYTDQLPSSWRWTVDLTAPDTAMSSGSASGRAASFAFSSPSADHDHFECRHTAPTGTATWRTCASTVHLNDLATGRHVIEARSVDRAGLTDATPVRYEWVVTATGPTGPTPRPDRTAPDTRVVSGPAQGSVLLSTTATLRAASAEKGIRFRCTLDGRAVGCAAGTLVLKGLRAGTHEVRMAAVDRAGNVDRTPGIRRFTVPVDLRKAKGWSRVAAKGALGGSVLRARKSKAWVRVAVARGTRSVVLIASSAKRGAKVTVYAGRKRLGSVSIPRGTRPRATRAVAVPVTFRGALKIVVSGKRGPSVRLDAVALLR